MKPDCKHCSRKDCDRETFAELSPEEARIAAQSAAESGRSASGDEGAAAFALF
jgi:hypothetical protein